ncbi:hypothetical protein [Corynebacterium aquilae]|uniref:Uncharacterized protein n=1 Tax=Corynebacterium aquilae DSM 44791 TaxID=1431546 RepID=A0A1L7CDX4_9CORY|nr:hypothetical protein [Corynebacterium aquilae]APT84028.1 hypothetical protein CAQU_01895 [Corynebacterium aquilae DSM 44791]
MAIGIAEIAIMALTLFVLIGIPAIVIAWVLRRNKQIGNSYNEVVAKAEDTDEPARSAEVEAEALKNKFNNT